MYVNVALLILLSAIPVYSHQMTIVVVIPTR